MKEQLIRITNTLGLISTKGEDTIYMANCLQALRQLIETIPEENENQKEED